MKSANILPNVDELAQFLAIRKALIARLFCNCGRQNRLPMTVKEQIRWIDYLLNMITLITMQFRIRREEHNEGNGKL